jgi:hypothetical protein
LVIECAFDGTSGSGLVPQRLLSSLKKMADSTPMEGGLSSELDTTTVVDGLTIVTQGYQSSPTTSSNFDVLLH